MNDSNNHDGKNTFKLYKMKSSAEMDEVKKDVKEDRHEVRCAADKRKNLINNATL